MARYKLTEGGVIDTEAGRSFPVRVSNRHYREYLKWVAKGNTPDPIDPAPTPPTKGEIYDQTMQNNKLLKAIVLAINDGTFVPGGNLTGVQLKAVIKAKM